MDHSDAQARAEMDLEDARAAAFQAIDDLCETFKARGPWAEETFNARRAIYTAAGRLNEMAVYRPELRLH